MPTAVYLGLNLHEQLSYNFHTDVTAKKATAFIASNIHSCPKKVKAACYTTLVPPMMEYATSVWAHHTVQSCHKLEQVQRRAARFHVTGTREQPVWQQWWAIWSESHWRPGVITNGWPCFIVCNITWCLITPADQFVPVQQSYSRRLGHDKIYQVPYARTNVCKYFFQTTVHMWNTLPASLIHSHSLQSFKTGISVYNRHWLTWP